MALDISLILRKWSFDMDSDVLGTLRFSNANPDEILRDDEAEIRAGSVTGVDLARRVFLKMAHKRTGIEAVDKGCEGPTFTDLEVATVPPDELDAFCDRLIHGRLQVVRDAGGSENAAPAIYGAAGLQAALVAFVDWDRAERKKATALMKSQIAAMGQRDAQTFKDMASVSSAFSATSAMQEELQRHQECINTAMDSIAGSVTTRAIKNIDPSNDLIKAATGYSTNVGIFQAIEASTRMENLEKLAGVIDSKNLHGLGDLSAVQRIMAAHDHAILSVDSMAHLAGIRSASIERVSVIPRLAETATPIMRMLEMPPNPIQKTNQIIGELLVHQREVAAKAEVAQAQAKSEAAVELTESNRIATSGLSYTKLGFWLAVLAFLFSSMWGVATYFEQKADAKAAKAEADESSRKAAIEIAKQHAEIRELAEALKRVNQPKQDAINSAKKIAPKIRHK